jgi:hypothetical protein
MPQPIHEGVKVLKQHLYISLSEVQIKREEEIAKNPLSKVREHEGIQPGCYIIELFYHPLLTGSLQHTPPVACLRRVQSENAMNIVLHVYDQFSNYMMRAT